MRTIKRMWLTIAATVGMSLGTAQEELRVVSGLLPDGVAPGAMVETWMRGKVAVAYRDWQEEFLRLQREGGWEAHRDQLRADILESIGGLPERTPLHAKATGEIRRPGFRVEKILFESQPKFYVTANLYLPESADFEPPYPGVLVPCGHAREAKAHHEYQAMGALLALNGMVGLVFDPLDQSERMQYRSENGEMPYYGTHMHMQEGVAATLLGEGLIRTFIWDGMRALDYLEGRPEVDPERLAVTGNSGGGTQTSHLFALDDRLKVAAPSCYVHLLNRQLWDSLGDAEQMIFGQLAMGLEHPSFYLMRAPAPVKILASTHDFFPIDAVWEGFRYIKRHYTDLGFSERADILENNEGHNYNRTQREAAIRWIHLWLKGSTADIREPDRELFTEEELRVTPTGQVLNLDGARSVFDLFRDKLAEVRPQRDADWAAMDAAGKRETVQTRVGVRSLEAIPRPKVHEIDRIDRGDYTLIKQLFETEEGLYLPVLDLRPKVSSGQHPLVTLDPDGAHRAATQGGALDQMARNGRRVVAVDIRGFGETRSTNAAGQGAFFGTDQTDFYSGYVLGENYLALRIEDILRAVRHTIETSAEMGQTVDLAAEGLLGIAALHAAFLAPERIGQTTLTRTLESWESILVQERSYEQLSNAVQGVLLAYDLPMLGDELGERLTIRNPVNSLGFSDLPEGAPRPDGFDDPDQPGLVGVFFGNARFLNPQGEYPLDRLALDYDNAVEKRGNDWGGIWSGFLVGPVDGEVDFQIVSDQAVSLVIDGTPVFALEDPAGTRTASVQLEKGRMYPIEVRFQLPSGGRGRFAASWSWADHAPSIIGLNHLKHSRAQEEAARRAWR